MNAKIQAYFVSILGLALVLVATSCSAESGTPEQSDPTQSEGPPDLEYMYPGEICVDLDFELTDELGVTVDLDETSSDSYVEQPNDLGSLRCERDFIGDDDAENSGSLVIQLKIRPDSADAQADFEATTPPPGSEGEGAGEVTAELEDRWEGAADSTAEWDNYKFHAAHPDPVVDNAWRQTGEYVVAKDNLFIAVGLSLNRNPAPDDPEELEVQLFDVAGQIAEQLRNLSVE